MKKITTLLFMTLGITVASMAQIVLTVDSANYNDGNGGFTLDTVNQIQVSGVVAGPNSYPTQNGRVFNISSHTRGLKVYSKSRFNYNIVDGDSVTVVGKLQFFNGQAELVPTRGVAGDTIYKVGTGIIDTPVVVDPNLYFTTQGEQYEALLIQINDVNMNTVGNWPATHTNHSFTGRANTNSGTTVFMFIDSFMAPDLWNGSAPAGSNYNVVGFGTQYDALPPYNNGYSIQPRSRADYKLQTVGIHDIQNPLTASVYPNPASTKITAAFISENDGDYTATITDLMGRVVLTEAGHVANGDNTLTINTANLSNGMYVLNLVAAGKNLITKVNIAK